MVCKTERWRHGCVGQKDKDKGARDRTTKTRVWTERLRQRCVRQKDRDMGVWDRKTKTWVCVTE